MAQPWIKWYPSDWRAEATLRVCSLAAQGLWMGMLCLMAEAEPRGSLKMNGRGITAKQLASLVGATLKEVEGYLRELEEAGVFSRDDDGTIFSRRIRRDEIKAAADRENGGRGGNPRLKGRDKSSDIGGVNPPNNPLDKAQKPDTRSQKPDPKSPKLTGGVETDPDPGVVRLRTEIMAAFTAAGSMSFPDTHRAEVWVSQGYDPALCISVIREVLAKKPSVSSLSYFEPAIARAHTERPSSPKPASTEPKIDFGGGCEWPESSVRTAVQRWQTDEKSWPDRLGPAPGSAGCLVPQRLIGQPESATGGRVP